MVKRHYSFFLALLLSITLILPVFAEEAPEWYWDRRKLFPDREYISALGTAHTEKEARNDALSQLAVFFESNVSVSNEATFSVTEATGVSSVVREMSGKTLVYSNAELPSVKFTESFYNPSQKEFSICAYINKKEAASALSAQIGEHKTKAKSFLKNALEQQSEDIFTAFTNAVAAENLLAQDWKNVRMLIVLSEAQGTLFFNEMQEMLESAEQIIRANRKKMTFTVDITGDDDWEITVCLEELLESQGFYCTGNARYTVSGTLRFSKQQNDAGLFVKPQLSLKIIDKEGDVVGSYSKAYTKYGHNNWQGAYSIAYANIKKDLEENCFDTIFLQD